jgi:predicted RNase H-like nuclease (RuvC/YqgF family)
MDGQGAVAAAAALETVDLSGIPDEGAREAIVRLTNLVEQLASENRGLREKVQRLQDELNRLKGQSPRPRSQGGKGQSQRQNYSSEQERREPQE